ncbi:MAG: Hpt domain-containing protein, partial [Planctomycetota bacterium]
MPLQSLMQQIVGNAQGVGADDLPELVELHDLLLSLSENEEATDDAIADLAKQASDRVQDVVMRDSEAVEDDIAFMHESIASLQAMIDGATGGQTDATTGSTDADPQDDTPNDRAPEPFQPDEELLEAWLPSVADTLSDIEGILLNDGAGEDEFAELRRHVHTLKGECGVVSAHNAQQIFHEAESAIDRSLATGSGLPTDELFGVLDWVRRDVDAIAGTPSSEIEIDEELFERLRTAPATGPAEVDMEAMQSEAAKEPEQQDADDGPVVMDCEVDDTVREFVGEAKEHIAAAEEALLQLESTPEDTEHIATVFRAFHTIKGVAGLLNMPPIVEVAHEAEFLLDDARNGDIAVSAPFCAISFAACDMLADLIGMLEDGPAPSNATMRDLVDRLKKAREGDIQPPEKSAVVAEPAPAQNAPTQGDTKQPAKQNAKRADQSVKVNTLRLD